jgi:hypothetical protein
MGQLLTDGAGDHRPLVTRRLGSMIVCVLGLVLGGAVPRLTVAQQVMSPNGAPGGAAIGLRHEPIFGVGPHTTWRGGWGVEVQVEQFDGETMLPVEVLYGVTEEITATLVLPFATPPAGVRLGEVGVRAKWRFATRFTRGRMDALALVGGMTLPRTAVDGVPVGGPIAMLGLASGRESRRWYYFGGVRGALRLADDGFDPGDMILANVAWGIRPSLSEFTAPDLVLLLEANGRFTGRTSQGGVEIAGSGGRVVSVAPGLLFSVGNIMLKGGLDVPIWDRLNDPDAPARVKLVAALEVHW